MKPEIYTKLNHGIGREKIDPDALSVVETLRKHGYLAYIVGGAVRDLLLNQKPKDFDISTSAKPEEIKALFKRCFLIGRRFRLAHVRFDDKVLEVSTFRKGNNEDDSLIIRDNDWGNEQEDVLRRDFTINGLFYDPIDETIIDYVDGYKDAKKFLLRSIGNSYVRFKQDPVRIIRLLKFRARFGLTVEQEAIDALLDCRSEILKSAPARVLEELLRMLEIGAARAFIELLANHNVLQIICPKISEFLSQDRGNWIYDSLAEVDRMVLNEGGKPPSRAVLLAIFVFPLLQHHIHVLHSKSSEIHLGDIQAEASFIVHDAFSPFLVIPKRLSAQMVTLLTSQFRFTPPTLQKTKRYKIPSTPDFDLAMEFFELRTKLEPGLQKLYEEWHYYWKKAKKQRQHLLVPSTTSPRRRSKRRWRGR